MSVTRPSAVLAASLLLPVCASCHSSATSEPTTAASSTATPVTDSCDVLTASEISAVLAMPIDPGKHVLKTSNIMCGWAKTGVTNDAEVILNFATTEYFEKEREPHPASR